MVTRRDFVKSCAGASGAAVVGLRPGTAAAADAPKKGGTLRVGFYIEAATMDPHLSGSKVDRQVYHNIYEPLVTLDTRLGIKPGLAESWSQPDPKTLVFKLRRGIKFHDGTDFNAEAAKFNFDRMKTEPKSIRKGEVANIDTVEVVDAATIKVNLKKADASLLATLTDRAGMMISPKVVQERGVELGRNAKGAGTGPFEFVEWVKDDHLLIKRNESYWNKQGGPYLERVRYRPIPDDVVKLQSLQAGEIDVMDYVLPRDVAPMKADKRLVVVDVPSLADFGYQLNHGRPPFNVKALRQAVAFSGVLSQRFKVEFQAHPFDLYRALRSVNPSPYMYYLSLGDRKVIGTSPAAGASSRRWGSGSGRGGRAAPRRRRRARRSGGSAWSPRRAAGRGARGSCPRRRRPARARRGRRPAGLRR